MVRSVFFFFFNNSIYYFSFINHVLLSVEGRYKYALYVLVSSYV